MDQNQLTIRQPYFVGANLTNSPVFCVDDRASDNGIYIKVPGGLAFLLNDLALMRLASDESFKSNISIDIKDLAKLLAGKNLAFGIHSDEDLDPTTNLNNTDSEALGCGYINKRREIMASIGNTSTEIIKDLERLMPELELDSKNKEKVQQLIALNKRLAGDDAYFNLSPRQMAKSVISQGTPTMIVKGQHDPQAIAIINLVPNTTLDNNQANQHKLPAYDYDDWAFNEVLNLLPDYFAWDKSLQQISALIDFIGTVRFLGVEDIFVRR